MKKLLSILFLLFLFISNAKAELFEINNCAITSSDGMPMRDKKGTLISHQDFVYDPDYYNDLNTALKIPKNKFIENYKKWGWNKEESDDWFYTLGEKGMVWKLAGSDIEVTSKKKPAAVIYDPWKQRIDDPYDYIWIDYISTLDEDAITKYQSIGSEFVTSYEKDVWSIDISSGLITYLRVYSDEYFRHKQNQRFQELIRLEKEKPRDEYYIKLLKQIPIKKVDTTTYEIESYAGGILIANEIDSSTQNKIVFDFNDLSLYKSYVLRGVETQFAKFKCPSSNDGETNETGSYSGTAFFVSNSGHLLTNNHVVEECSVSKITYLNNEYEAQLLATDKTLDLALLKTEINPKSYFNFSKDGANKLNKIYVAGYPLGKGLSDDLKITSGIVSSLKGFDDNSNEIQIDAPINPGNSGGPIINENGDLVAIAVSGLAKDQTEGINFGIKSSAAELFLKSNKVTPKKSMYDGIKDNNKLLEILEDGTVYTYCN
ncbi:S1C family serine protease [Candidatus Pelagibacter sp.]|uniref:S1C family serine protease n=1 Tax=Candidatus Pelagibacter sp. TaxID=2024849 RepID=UPI003F853CDF